MISVLLGVDYDVEYTLISCRSVNFPLAVFPSCRICQFATKHLRVANYQPWQVGDNFNLEPALLQLPTEMICFGDYPRRSVEASEPNSMIGREPYRSGKSWQSIYVNWCPEPISRSCFLWTWQVQFIRNNQRQFHVQGYGGCLHLHSNRHRLPAKIAAARRLEVVSLRFWIPSTSRSRSSLLLSQGGICAPLT